MTRHRANCAIWRGRAAACDCPPEHRGNWLRQMPWWFRWIVMPACVLLQLMAMLAACVGRT